MLLMHGAFSCITFVLVAFVILVTLVVQYWARWQRGGRGAEGATNLLKRLFRRASGVHMARLMHSQCIRSALSQIQR